MLIKIHKSYRDVVAICDSELINKKFEQGKFQLDVKENFFNGEKVNENQLLNIIKKMSLEDATFNIIGEKATNTAIKAEIILQNQIKKINGIPFALVLI